MIIKYKELAADPKDGIYRVIGTKTHIIVTGNKLIHSPHGMTIRDDAILEKCD